VNIADPRLSNAALSNRGTQTESVRYGRLHRVQPDPLPLRVLHIEVGGTFGGSTRALAAYLTHSDRNALKHDVLFYYPTPGADMFRAIADRVMVLEGRGNPFAHSRSALRRALALISRTAGNLAVRANAYKDAREVTDLIASIPLTRRLGEAIAGGAYDLVHINNTVTYQAPSILAAHRLGLPIVAHLRNPIHVTPLTSRLIKRTSCLVAVNHSITRELAEAGIHRTTRTIWDLTEIPRVLPEQRRCAREEFAARGDRLIAAVGRLEEQKGYEDFLHAARRVIARMSNVVFVVVGEGSQRARLERLALRLNLSKHVIFAGFRSDAAAIMAAADLFVCSSLWEGGPLTLIEAMLLGTPVVSTHVGIAGDAIGRAFAAALVPPGNAEALGNAMVATLSCDKSQLARMGASGRMRALKFSNAARHSFELDRVFSEFSPRHSETPALPLTPVGKAQLPSVSVVIPTKNRVLELREVFGRLVHQTHLPEQIIVVDQSSDDCGRKAVYDELSHVPATIRASMRLDYVLDTTISGAASARNRGIELARSEITLFLDDDVQPEPVFIENLVRVFRGHPTATGVSGVITNYLPPAAIFRWWTRIFVRGGFHDERQPIYWKASKMRSSTPIRVNKFGAGLMAFRARAIVNHRFDSNLSAAEPAEDVDFCVRLEPALFLIAPGARLTHRRSVAGRSESHWLELHAQAAFYLYRRNWQSDFRQRIAFAWLNCGYAIAAGAAILRRRSLEPLRALRRGIHQAHRLTGSHSRQHTV